MLNRYIIIFLFLFISSCVRDNQGVNIGDKIINDSLLSSFQYQSIWGRYIKNGQYDVVINEAEPVFRESVNIGDIKLQLYSAIYLSQSYLFIEKYDLAKEYLDFALRNSYKYEDEDFFYTLMINNVAAIYAMKTSFDYATALNYLENSLDASIKQDDSLNHSALLCNIASIYYFRKDTAGIKYAQAAYDMGEKLDMPNRQSLNAVRLSSMFLLNGSVNEALRYAEKGIEIIKETDYDKNKSLVYLTYAEALLANGDIMHSQEYYEKSLSFLNYANESIRIQVYLSYGNFILDKGETDKAIEMYLSSLELAKKMDNVEYTYEILYGLYMAYEKKMDVNLASEYYKKYNEASDSVFNIRKEYEFNNLLLQNEKIKHREENKIKELQLLKKSRSNVIAGFIIVVISISLACSYILYRRKNMMYHNLVKQYQNFRKSISDIKIAKENKGIDSKRDLFEKLEKLMQDDKLYRRKDLSLPMLSELMSTNVTYLSTMINQFSGKSFPNYLNSYRIEDVLDSLSNPENTDSIVTIFKNAGYTSNTTSYRAFQKEVGCTPMQYRKEVLKIKSNITEI